MKTVLLAVVFGLGVGLAGCSSDTKSSGGGNAPPPQPQDSGVDKTVTPKEGGGRIPKK